MFFYLFLQIFPVLSLKYYCFLQILHNQKNQESRDILHLRSLKLQQYDYKKCSNSLISSVLFYLMRRFSRQPIKSIQKQTRTQRTLTAQKSTVRTDKDSEVMIGKYKYSENDELGKGYSGKVYKAVEASKLHKRFAIKVIDLQKFRGENLKMLETEIEIHKSLDHENIVKLHQVIKTNEFYYLVMEYCPHGNLTEYIAQKKKLSQTNALQILSQLISAYKHLLQQGVIHRDIKPANILRMGNKWKLSDFGFSAKSRLGFKDKMNVGTPLYMAPESLKKSYYTYKSDIFSIGIVLYEMLMGQTPREVNSRKELFQRIEHQINVPSSIKNCKIRQFLSKACLVSEGKRMSRYQFLNFDFVNSNASSMCTQSNSCSILSYKGRKDSTDASTLKNIDLYSKIRPKDLSKQSSKVYLSREAASSSKSKYSNLQQSTKPSSKNTMFANKEHLQQQLAFIKYFYFTIKNIDSFHLQKTNQSIFVLTLFKLLLKLLRLLCDKNQNYLHLHNWEEFIQCKLYQQLYAQFNLYSQKFQKQYLDFIKHNDIKVIRAVNRKFPQLCNIAPLTTKFYQNFKGFLILVVKEHETYVTDLLERGEEHLSNRIQALQSVFKIYKFAQTRTCVSQGKNMIQKLNILEDYTKSKLNLNSFNHLKRLIKQI